jgi:hypothetical protein
MEFVELTFPPLDFVRKRKKWNSTVVFKRLPWNHKKLLTPRWFDRGKGSPFYNPTK